MAAVFSVPVPRLPFQAEQESEAARPQSALTYKVQDDQIKVVENFTFDAPRTKAFVAMAKALGGRRQEDPSGAQRPRRKRLSSMRNVPNANIITATDVNTYAIMHANAILITEDSLNVLQQSLTLRGQTKTMDITIQPIVTEKATQAQRQARPLHLPCVSRGQQVSRSRCL